MAARLVRRFVCLCRQNATKESGFTRKMSIFTRYREPPNGFLFNEKVGSVIFFRCLNHGKYCRSILMKPVLGLGTGPLDSRTRTRTFLAKIQKFTTRAINLTSCSQYRLSIYSYCWQLSLFADRKMPKLLPCSGLVLT